MSVTVSPRIRAEAVAAAATKWEIDPISIMAPGRARHASHARQYAMWLLRCVKSPDGAHRYSYPAIGRAFDKDHTTALHAVRQVEKRRALSTGPVNCGGDTPFAPSTSREA